MVSSIWLTKKGRPVLGLISFTVLGIIIPRLFGVSSQISPENPRLLQAGKCQLINLGTLSINFPGRSSINYKLAKTSLAAAKVRSISASV